MEGLPERPQPVDLTKTWSVEVTLENACGRVLPMVKPEHRVERCQRRSGHVTSATDEVVVFPMD